MLVEPAVVLPTSVVELGAKVVVLTLVVSVTLAVVVAGAVVGASVLPSTGRQSE